MELYLLRHAEAENRVPDEARELTRRGRQSIVNLANFLKGRMQMDVDAIWHSPLVRAAETANLFRETFALDAPITETEGLLPMNDPGRIVQKLEAAKIKVLLVGHNPHFESLTTELLGLHSVLAPVNVPKASLLRFKRYGEAWQLRDLLTTKVTGV